MTEIGLLGSLICLDWDWFCVQIVGCGDCCVFLLSFTLKWIVKKVPVVLGIFCLFSSL